MDVSIVIVSYNTKHLLKNCLDSIYKNTKDIQFEVIVVDNCSSDGTLSMLDEFSNIKIIKNDFNYGFGKANNIGKTIATGKYIFYLNSDTVLLNNAVKIFFDYWESHASEPISAIGTVLINEDGLQIHSGGRFPTYPEMLKKQLKRNIRNAIKTIIKVTRLEKQYLKRKSNKEIIENNIEDDNIQYVTGADLFMLNNDYAVYDENYFMYYEESDMQYQLYKRGMKPVLVRRAKIQHLSYKPTDKIILARITDIYIEKSMLYYCKKNYNSNASLLRFLIAMDSYNPYVKPIVEQAEQHLKDYYRHLHNESLIDD